jgi:site-specific recombinase XerD
MASVPKRRNGLLEVQEGSHVFEGSEIVKTRVFELSRELSLKDLKSLRIPFRIDGNALVLAQSSRGYTLKDPVRVPIKSIRRAGQRGVVEYVFRSLSSERPRLIPFVFDNRSCLELARYLLMYRTGSAKTLYLYLDAIARYFNWVKASPDELIKDLVSADEPLRGNRLRSHVSALEKFVGNLQDDGLSPLRICNYVKAIRALYRANGIDLRLPRPLSRRIVYRDRAPRPEELAKLIEVADIREKVIISMIALGGFREGTLVRLNYGHVRDDLEREISPLHIHVESEITKGKYHDYDTFFGREAADYLKLYLEERTRGSPDGKISPETITDDSPLIRNETSRCVKPIGEKEVYKLIHNLYFKAGLLKPNLGRRYDLKVHSIRKYFKTQLIALGVQSDYVDFMMGHTVDTYDDVRSKGIEFLRNVYASSGLSIKSKTKVSKIDALKEIIRAWGMDPDKILAKEASSEPHRAYIGYEERENHELESLRQALKEIVKKELLE